MIYDGHALFGGANDSKETFIKRLDEAGFSKVLLTSYPPESIVLFGLEKPADRLGLVMEWKAAYPDRIYPFYWIDPLEDDVFDQIDRAVAAGVSGFKVICNRHYPNDDRPMQVWEYIAKTNKPLLFHSGISWSNAPNRSTSVYNRPVYFEDLFFVPNLKFALAHVSWPWHDECLAVFGKWEHAKRHGHTTSELYLNTTPGTPEIYREELFFKIYNIGYRIEDNLMFGTDCTTDYNADYAKQIVAMDKKALDSVGVTQEQREKYYVKNFCRFVGIEA